MSVTVVTRPSVYLVGSSAVDLVGLDSFLDAEGIKWITDTTSSTDGLPEIAGRLCYMSFKKPRPGGNRAYLEHIKEVGHGSVLEHSSFNLIITGVSRSFTHELVRHRVGFSYSQLSQRYVDESEVAFVVPPLMLGWHAEWSAHLVANTSYKKVIGDWDSGLNRSKAAQRFEDWVQCRKFDLLEYRSLSDELSEELSHIEDRTARRKAAREAARSVLPNCTETKIFITGNGRSFRHFIELRSDPAADAEIRRVAVAVLRVLRSASPNLFGDYTVESSPDGSETAVTPYRKV